MSRHSSETLPFYSLLLLFFFIANCASTLSSSVKTAENVAPVNHMDQQAEELGHFGDTKRIAAGIEMKFSNQDLFEPESGNLRKSAYALLNDLSQVLVRYPTNHVLVSEHMLTSGNDFKSQTISERRASNIRRILIQHGVMPDQISAEGFGNGVAMNASVTDKKNSGLELRIEDWGAGVLAE